MTRCGISSDSTLDHYNSGQLQLTANPSPALTRPKSQTTSCPSASYPIAESTEQIDHHGGQRSGGRNNARQPPPALTLDTEPHLISIGIGIGIGIGIVAEARRSGEGNRPLTVAAMAHGAHSELGANAHRK